MNVSLEQAIEIHARALRLRGGARAPDMARAKATRCNLSGDPEGTAVWLKVASAVETLLKSEAERNASAGA